MASKPRPPPDYDENPEWTEEDFARAKPLSAFPELEAAFRKGGRPRAAEPKAVVSVRLAPSVLAFYAGPDGKGASARMAKALEALAAKGRRKRPA